MKKNILFGAMLLTAGSLLAADSSPKDDVAAAAKKLADTSYSWKMTMDMGANSPFTPGPTEGKTEKDGYTWLSTTFQDTTSIGLAKGKKVAVKTEEGWKSGEELGAAGGAGGGGGGGGFGDPNTRVARRMSTLKTPAVEIQELLSKVGDLKKDADVISGDLTKEGAESLLTGGFGFGGGRPGGGGGNRPAPKDAKGSVKIWLKDGEISKYETKVSGKMEFGGEERDMERNNTTEIKDIGKTKIEVPDDAKKKLS
jgi:hypothetical protein